MALHNRKIVPIELVFFKPYKKGSIILFMLHNAAAWQEARYLPVFRRDKRFDFSTIQQKQYNKNYKVRISKEFWISLLAVSREVRNLGAPRE